MFRVSISKMTIWVLKRMMKPISSAHQNNRSP